jgi:hypothetical protein
LPTPRTSSCSRRVQPRLISRDINGTTSNCQRGSRNPCCKYVFLRFVSFFDTA